jgi:hypothetical protein
MVETLGILRFAQDDGRNAQGQELRFGTTAEMYSGKSSRRDDGRNA